MVLISNPGGGGGAYRRDTTLLENARGYKAELMEQIFGIDTQAVVSFSANSQPPSVLSAIPPGNNIVGVGFGVKTTVGAAVEGEIAVRVYVRAKRNRADIPRDEFVPSDINGVPTDVIPVGDLAAFPGGVRPAPGGASVGHKSITAGTLGCWVRPVGATGPLYILSNNHVLANSNAATVGDEILQPGPLDGGLLPMDVIARLHDFEPLLLTAPGSPTSSTPNLIDAAIAEVVEPAQVNPAILSIGRVSPPTMAASLYQSVRKHGRTTLHTVGVITDVSASVRVRYGTQVADFDDQIAIIGAGGTFSAGGDSGSLIVDAVSRRPVALLFAGGGSTTFANPIDDVLARFGVEIL